MTNLILNSGFNYAQRCTSQDVDSTSTTVVSFNPGSPNTNDIYTFDQWKANSCLHGAWNYYTNPGAGPTSKTCGLYSNAFNADKILIYQPIESVYTKTLAGVTVTLQAQIKVVSGTCDVNIGLLKWAGTADYLNPKVMTAWSSGTGNDPTWNTDYSLDGKTTITATINWQQIYYTTTLSTTDNNILPAIWCDSTLTSGLYVAEVMLTVNDQVQPYASPTNELNTLQRYCKLIRTPGNYTLVTFGFARTTTEFRGIISYNKMRTIPTCTLSAVNTWLIQLAGGNTAVTAASAGQIGPDSLMLTMSCAGGLTAGQGGLIFDNNTNTTILLDAGL